MNLTKLLIFFILGTVFISLVVPPVSLAASGTLSGHVTTTSGKPVASAVVTVYDMTGHRVAVQCLTDKNGLYTASITVGSTYRVNASKAGVGAATSDNFAGALTVKKDIAISTLPAHVQATPDKSSVVAIDFEPIVWDNYGEEHETAIHVKITDVYGDEAGQVTYSECSITNEPWDYKIYGSLSGIISYDWQKSIFSGGRGNNYSIYYWGANNSVGADSVTISVKLWPVNATRYDDTNCLETKYVTISIIKIGMTTATPTVAAVTPTPWPGEVTPMPEATPTAMPVTEDNTPTVGPDGGIPGPDLGPTVAPPVIEGGDTTAPTTRLTLAGTPGGTDVYTTDVQVILLAGDGNGSGVQSIHYSLDGSNWSLYEAPFMVEKEGVNTVYYYSVDNANNTEDTQVKPFTITYQAKSTPGFEAVLALAGLLGTVVALGATKRRKSGR